MNTAGLHRPVCASGTRNRSIAKGGTAVKGYRKKNFPVDDVRRFLEPGPIVLVSSAWKGETNIMTMGWHRALRTG